MLFLKKHDIREFGQHDGQLLEPAAEVSNSRSIRRRPVVADEAGERHGDANLCRKRAEQVW